MVIEIFPPFWVSPWANFLYTGIGLLLFFTLIRLYHKNVNKENKNKIQLLEDEKEKELYKAKIEFFTNVAHEIRTPLTLIKGPLEKVLKSDVGIPEMLYNLHIMEKNTSRFLELADQLLDFRKTETKSFSLSYTNTNVSQLLGETFLRFKPAAEQIILRFSLQLPDDPVYAYVDREAFTKILSNLFNNSLKYAEYLVDISLLPLENDDPYFKVLVKNDGRILTSDVKEKIFTPFFRIPSSNEKPGAGIGLPLSRSLAELHNGSLELKEAEPYLNSFLLQLPLHQDKEYRLFDKEIMESVSLSPTTDLECAKTPILIVEDNPEMLDFVANELSNEYHIFKAGDGNTA